MSSRNGFRIVSFNLHDERVSERHPAVVRCIEHLAPHILCTQEGSPAQLRNILSSLSSSSWCYVGDPYDEWDTANAIFFRSDLFELLCTDTFWLSENPRTMAKGWDAPSLRACTWVDLREKSTGRRLVVYNVHLDAVSAKARFHSISLLFDSICQNLLSDSRLTLGDMLLAGDFNCWPEEVDGPLPMDLLVDLRKNAPEILLLKETGFMDTCLCSLRENKSTYNGYRACPFGPKIDFIWCQEHGSFNVRDGDVSLYQEDGKFCSDHCPVYADLEWSEN